MNKHHGGLLARYQVFVASLPMCVLVSIEGPVSTSETSAYLVLHTFSAAAHSNTGHMTQTRSDMGHMTQSHLIRVFINVCLKLNGHLRFASSAVRLGVRMKSIPLSVCLACVSEDRSDCLF